METRTERPQERMAIMLRNDPGPRGGMEDQLNPIERQALAALPAHGSVPVRRIPLRWPLIRAHLPLVLDRLAAAGLVQLGPSTHPGGEVALTERGQASLAGVSPAERPAPAARAPGRR